MYHIFFIHSSVAGHLGCFHVLVMYTMEYYSAIKRNKIMPFAMTWIYLETVIQSKVSQKEKNKYRILMHICGT